MAKKVNLSVGRGEKLPVSKGAGLTELGRRKSWNSPRCKNGNWVCIKCKEEKELIANFYKKSSSKTGFANVCKKCDAVRIRQKDKRRSNEDVRYYIKRLLSGRNSGMNSNSRKSGWGSNLTWEFIHGLYLKQSGLCSITGENMTHIAGKGRVATNLSIDRIDSSLPYDESNIQLVCYIVNIMKNSFSLEELKNWAYKIYNNGKSNPQDNKG